jgi:hypothetical protein
MASMSHGSRRRARAVRGRCLSSFAALLVACQVASAAHMLLVPHAVDPVDGQLVHPQHVQARGGRPERIARHLVEPRDPPDLDQGDDHCQVAAQRREPFVGESPSTPLRLPPALALGECGPMAGAVAGQIPVHRLAPKQSPPV